jgi:hypothetical protein
MVNTDASNNGFPKWTSCYLELFTKNVAPVVFKFSGKKIYRLADVGVPLPNNIRTAD